MIHVLNESLRIPQRLLTLQTVPNHLISYRNFMGGNNSTDLLLLQHNINEGIIARFKQGKSTQSSEKNDSLKQRQECIEESAESSEKPHEWRSDGYQISTEKYRKIRNDLLNHDECYQSIKSNSSNYSDKPVLYNNQRVCESYTSKPATRIMSEKWICGKPATERKIYYKCKPKSCIYPDNRKEPIHFPSSRDNCKDKSKQTAPYPMPCSESETLSSKEITSNEKKASSVKHKIPKKYPTSDTYKYDRRPDPPPPRYPHWSENPPPYCDDCLKKTTRSSLVKASPMIFIPDKGPRKSRAKDIVSPPQNIHETSSRSPKENECGGTDAKASHLQKSVSKKRSAISFKDKCAAFLTIPSPNGTMESEIQQFPTLTRDGRCCVEKPEKNFVTPDVSDCNPNMASFKYRLSKCPNIKEMWGIGIKRKPPVDVNVRQEALLSDYKKIKRSKSRRETTRKKRFKSRVPSNGWTQQRYKIRLKIFQKRNSLDPCLPRIVELIQPRGEKLRSELLKFAASKGESFSQLKSLCSHNCPSKMPIVKTKSYPTKMNESSVIRDQYLRKQPCKKRR
ncbi:hypothetical protein ALC62_02447 [Cyphomyrmex costatus]|uniref:Uncharacterized protein n=1 Tax=Cyphomyrmex costatus TaxID=456900 RepID=A0A195D110_9HYME|nr:hypothetical protein ALC62_02447 [Cyphomyrmex costatus]